MAFLSGVTGQFYKQFAVTIAISTVISAVNSLTLSPALAARLLRGHDAPKDALARGIERTFGWLFQPFNREAPAIPKTCKKCWAAKEPHYPKTHIFASSI